MKNKRIKVLLIEDNPGDVRLIREMLAEATKEDTLSLNVEMLSVGSLSKGLECLKKGGIDMILLDLGLPDSQGFDTFTKVYNQIQEVPIVVMTGIDDEKLGVRAVQEGAQDYIVKGNLNANLLMRSICYALERHRLRSKLQAMSFTDELTGTYNRRGFLFLAQQQLKIARRSKREMSLIFADLDNIKWINDNFGHYEGDLVLIEAANILKETFRESDIIARIGGDEFVVLAVDMCKDNVDNITTQLQNTIEAHNKKEEHPYNLSISIGVATFDPEYPCSIEELITCADKSMYKYKKKKRHRRLKEYSKI